MKLLLSILLLCLAGVSFGQTYDPSTGTVSNKPYSPGQGFATDSRSMFYDANFGLWRDYANTAEVLSYLNLSKYRLGGYDIYIHSGGTLTSGVWVGGTRSVYWFKDGTNNSNLVLKSSVTTVNGQTGVVITKNADSLKGLPVDTGAVARNGYYLVYDSTNKKFQLIQPLAGYTPGTGISIISNVISAQNTNPLWNAASLRGRNITTAAPATGTVPTWTGTQFDFLPGSGGSSILSGFIRKDTMFLVSATDSVKIPNTASRTYVDSVIANIVTNPTNFDATFLGTGEGASPIRPDTVNYYFTITMGRVMAAAIKARIDSVISVLPSGGSTGGKTQIINLSSTGDSVIVKANDSLFYAKKLKAGANVTFSAGDSSITINSTPGTAEINTDPFTTSASTNRSVASGVVVDYVEVNPVSDLLAFKMGSVSDDDAYIFPTPCAGGKWTLIECNAYFPSGTNIYFAGITSSTNIKIHKQIQHE